MSMSTRPRSTGRSSELILPPSERAKISKKIVTIKSRRRTLERQLRSLRDEQQEMSSLLAPIRRLPDEILIRIISQALPLVIDSETLEYESLPYNYYRNRLTFVLICYRWKRVVYGTPALWAHLPVYSQSRPPVVEHWLHLSQSTPLHLHIEGPRANNQTAVMKIVATILPHLARVISIIVQDFGVSNTDPHPNQPDMLFEMFPSNSVERLPNLKLLGLRYVVGDRTGPILSNLGVSKLETLILTTNCSYFFTNLARVESLRALEVTLEDSFDFTHLCDSAPNLEILVLQFEDSGSEDEFFGEGPFNLPKLRTLDIIGFQNAATFQLLLTLQIPKLQTLSLYSCQKHVDPSLGHVNLPICHWPELQALKFHSFDLTSTAEEALSFFTPLTNLRCLDLRGCILPESFFRKIINKTSQQNICSNLWSITLYGTDYSNDDLALYLISRNKKKQELRVKIKFNGVSPNLHPVHDSDDHRVCRARQKNKPSIEQVREMKYLENTFPGILTGRWISHFAPESGDIDFEEQTSI